MLSIWGGAFGHAILTVSGLSTIVAASAIAFSAVKWIGFKAIRSSGLRFYPPKHRSKMGFGAFFAKAY